MHIADKAGAVEWIRPGIDWISCSFNKEEYAATAFHRVACSLVEDLSRQGNEVKERSMLGYCGYSAGPLFIGENDRGYYLQISGKAADQYYEQIDVFNPHYSRIDVQVTVKFVKYRDNIAKDAYNAATSETQPVHSGRRPKAYIIIGSDGGDTFYLGAPSSSQRSRIYNKERQSELPDYRNCWRYEVMFRDELSRQWANEYRSALDTRAGYCAATVAEWLTTRGICVPFDKYRELLILPRIRINKTDIERKLEWLEKQVKPTTKYLCEMGFRDILMELLLSTPEL